ncbi:hypothetical protein M1563_01275 [Patescibacteria group bacterium]|nr:hypothetical protein [Patescibacteria group bacterium]MCL5410217.1 hypothetical protein [Patescibacteria group bacterium]
MSKEQEQFRPREETDRVVRAAQNYLAFSEIFSGGRLRVNRIRQAQDPTTMIGELMSGDGSDRADLVVAAGFAFSLGVLEAIKYTQGKDSSIVEGYLERGREIVRIAEEIMRRDI